MALKSEIKKLLSDKLNSGSWNKIKTSLVGKELIAYGAEVIAAEDNIKDAFTQSLNPELADKRGLISVANINKVVCSFIEPTFIIARIPDRSGTFNKEVYAPYELIIQCGNETFYNTTYCKEGDEVVFYQGNVVKMASPLYNSTFPLKKLTPFYIPNNGQVAT